MELSVCGGKYAFLLTKENYGTLILKKAILSPLWHPKKHPTTLLSTSCPNPGLLLHNSMKVCQENIQDIKYIYSCW